MAAAAFDQRLDTTQAGRVSPQTDLRGNGFSLLRATADLDGDDRAEARETHTFHRGMALQPVCQHSCVGAGALDPQVHGSHPAQCQPGLHRTRDRAVEKPVLGQVLLEPAAPVGVGRHRGAENDIRVPGEELRDRVNHHVGTHGQRLLDQRSGKGVVADSGGANSVGGLEETRQVGDLEHRVGGGLRPQDVGSRQRRDNRRRVTDVDAPQDRLPGLLEGLQEQSGACVGVRGNHDDRPVRCQGKGCRDGRHAGGEDQGGSALERAQGLLERGPRGIATAGVVDRTVRHVGRGELKRGIEAGTGEAWLSAGCDQDRSRGESLVFHVHSLRVGPRIERRCHSRMAFAVGRGVDLARAIGSQAMSDSDQNRPEATALPPKKPTVAVVFGGRSSEHAVSCSTAAGVMAAIDRDVYDVIPIGIAKDGRWVLASGDTGALELSPGHVPEVDGSGAAVLVPFSTTERSFHILEPGVPPRVLGEVDVVFPLLHGPFGEDGTIQGLLELADIRYVGSGVLASAVMMDKQYMKVVFAGHGLPVGPYVVITDRGWQQDPAASMAAVASLNWPVFVKPARAGSSMGITKVSGPEDLQAAIEIAREHDPKVLVEAAIVGREIECAVLEARDGTAPRTSEVGEIEVVRGHDFYDFEAKYLAESDVELSCPARVPEHVADEVRRLAAAAFEAAGCEGLARVDCFLTEHGDVIINEINTMPGFTPQSMYPRMWAASGLDYPKLIDELIQLALARRTGLR